MDSTVCVIGEDHILGDLEHLLDLVVTLVDAKLGKSNCVDQYNIPRGEPEIDE